ncbi:ankyrin repeat and SAM domain containing protein 6 [Cordyceps militaris CM01]|uniref:Ankyrin repeat and SAM domain containing protein 6 n=1 Tax=Cordyceps militaris (strain CM01) TaxID=983644 RepID=G3J6R2_CORMM|nr:ankyrin repeat and SAM domain containing protein 6 [Cordyceps militaris CM01]EGX95390.1 ankyrin repeat and SAM domain containing protein 6 [Cordyceps militaris CM01]
MEAQREVPVLYEYSSLQHATSFRVATLLPGRGDEPIRCTLEEVQWSDERQYEAISYAWGDPSMKVPILVHNGTLKVTRNLQTALFHLRHQETPRVLWVDAICTNQSDIPERGAQVRQMRRIFETATSVVIWLGPDNEGRQAADAVRGVQRIAEHACQQLGITLDSLASVEQVYHSVLFQHRDRLVTLLPGDDDDLVPWAAVLWFYQHAYFTRVWVIQEINANRRRIVLCGPHAVSWDAVELVAGCVVLASTFAGAGGAPATCDFSDAFCWWASTAPSELRQAGNWLHVLYLASNFAATDPRDVVYGLRGMMDCGDGGRLLDPDYSKTTLQVYRDVVEASLVHYKTTNALLYVAAVEGRPSWIPFWNEAMLFRNPFRFGNPMPWRPAGGSEARWTVDRDNYILSLEGFYLGAVQAAEPYYETVFRGGGQSSHVAETWQRLLDLLAATGTGELPLSEDTLVACATSFCYGQDETCQPAEEATLARNFVVYLKSVLHHDDFAKYIGSAFSDPKEEGHDTVFGKPVWDFEYPESSFFILDDESRSPGCCIAPVAPRDVVFVPLGCTYPLVLRANGDGRFRIRGYCFVHGAMRGERQTSATSSMSEVGGLARLPSARELLSVQQFAGGGKPPERGLLHIRPSLKVDFQRSMQSERMTGHAW